MRAHGKRHPSRAYRWLHRHAGANEVHIEMVPEALRELNRQRDGHARRLITRHGQEYRALIAAFVGHVVTELKKRACRSARQRPGRLPAVLLGDGNGSHRGRVPHRSSVAVSAHGRSDVVQWRSQRTGGGSRTMHRQEARIADGRHEKEQTTGASSSDGGQAGPSGRRHEEVHATADGDVIRLACLCRLGHDHGYPEWLRLPENHGYLADAVRIWGRMPQGGDAGP
jgi:hypothetical protein